MISGPTPWPVIILAVITVVILLGLIFLCNLEPGFRNWSIFLLLVLTLIGALVLYFFCWTHYHTFAWFLLLLPLALIFTGIISYWLASQTTCKDYVLGHWLSIDIYPQNKRD